MRYIAPLLLAGLGALSIWAAGPLVPDKTYADTPLLRYAQQILRNSTLTPPTSQRQEIGVPDAAQWVERMQWADNASLVTSSVVPDPIMVKRLHFMVIDTAGEVTDLSEIARRDGGRLWQTVQAADGMHLVCFPDRRTGQTGLSAVAQVDLNPGGGGAKAVPLSSEIASQALWVDRGVADDEAGAFCGPLSVFGGTGKVLASGTLPAQVLAVHQRYPCLWRETDRYVVVLSTVTNRRDVHDPDQPWSQLSEVALPQENGSPCELRHAWLASFGESVPMPKDERVGLSVLSLGVPSADARGEYITFRERAVFVRGSEKRLSIQCLWLWRRATGIQTPLHTVVRYEGAGSFEWRVQPGGEIQEDPIATVAYDQMSDFISSVSPDGRWVALLAGNRIVLIRTP